jgi:hypothetical protein
MVAAGAMLLWEDVRPVFGQTFPPTMDVECSRPVQKLYPGGTRFRIYAKETNREAGKPNAKYDVQRDDKVQRQQGRAGAFTVTVVQ